jgi:predicted metalloprotease with PDZ domain
MFKEKFEGVVRDDNPSRKKAAKQKPGPEISHTVSMPQPATHLLEVEMRVKWRQMPDALELKMPVWTPGSYLIREFARHVQGFSAANSRGRAIEWRKINKNTWQLDTKGLTEVAVSYKVYSNELTVRTNELNDEHAFWNNSALLLFPAGQLAAPSTLRVIPFANWKAATGLRRVPKQRNTFYAENYDILYDSPFEVSDLKEAVFTVAGKPHRIVVTGEGNYDLKQIAIDAAKIGKQAVKIFGELPIDDYLFILNLRGRGGLEHLNSAALQWGRFNFKPRAQYIKFLHLLAHEYFHLWNVKRIRPDVLGPFDYENENYTRLLWVAEGATAYYEAILLSRAGLITDKELFGEKAVLIQQLQHRPGRFEASLEEASLDAWIKYYRQDQNAVNNQISYYDKGEIVNMLLDISIRTSSKGKRSLDDVMRHLYREFYRRNRNYTAEDFQRVAEKMAGSSLDDLFSKYVRGREEIDFDRILGGVGLRLIVARPNAGKAYIGAEFAEENGRLVVKAVPSGTPACAQGLNAGDQIVAIGGYRASRSFLETYLEERKPNAEIRLTVFRFDRLRDITIIAGPNERAAFEFCPVDDPSDEQCRLYRQYLGSDLANLK